MSDPWALDPHTPVDASMFASAGRPTATLPPGLRHGVCKGCGKPIIIEAPDPVMSQWNPKPITGGQLTIARILGRELLRLTGSGPAYGCELVWDEPDPGSRCLEEHECRRAAVADATDAGNVEKQDSKGEQWTQGTF